MATEEQRKKAIAEATELVRSRRNPWVRRARCRTCKDYGALCCPSCRDAVLAASSPQQAPPASSALDTGTHGV